MLRVYMTIYENQKSERELLVDYCIFNELVCNLNFVVTYPDNESEAISYVRVDFSKTHQDIVYDTDSSMPKNYFCWATNRSTIVVNEIKSDAQDKREISTDEERDELKEAMSLIFNDSPEFEMIFVYIGEVLPLSIMQEANYTAMMVKPRKEVLEALEEKVDGDQK